MVLHVSEGLTFKNSIYHAGFICVLRMDHRKKITFSLYKINLLVWATCLVDRLLKKLFLTFQKEKIYFFFIIWCNSPQRARASSFMRFLDNTQPQSVGILWTSDQPVVETST